MAIDKALLAWLQSGQAELEAMQLTGWRKQKFHVIPSKVSTFKHHLMSMGARFVQQNIDGSIDAWIAPRHIDMLMREKFCEFDARET